MEENEKIRTWDKIVNRGNKREKICHGAKLEKNNKKRTQRENTWERGKTWYWCRAREKIKPVQTAGKNATGIKRRYKSRDTELPGSYFRQ